MSRQLIHIPNKLADKAADKITSFVGSWLCIGLHTAWFVAWFVLHLDINLLTNIVSLEAIYLSAIIMISQNRQGAKDHARDDLEAVEVDDLHSMQGELYKINQAQLDILHLLEEQREQVR